MKTIKGLFQPVSFTNWINVFFECYFMHKGEPLQLYTTRKTWRQYREHNGNTEWKISVNNAYLSPNSRNYCMNLHNLVCFCLLCSAWIPQYKGEEKHFPPYRMLSTKKKQTYVRFKQSPRWSYTKRKVAWFLRWDIVLMCHSKNIYKQVIKVCTTTNTDKRTSLTLFSQPHSWNTLLLST